VRKLLQLLNRKVKQMASEFSLNGGYDPRGDKFAAIVELRTPDGRVTRTEGDVLYDTEEEATASAQSMIEQILASPEFKGTEVVAKNGVPLQ
jgi:hypothetical protein